MKLQTQQPQPQGWWDTLKETFSLEHISKRFNLSFTNLIEVASYLSIGFISGFLIKKYGRYVVCILFIAGLSICILAYLNVATIDWVKARVVLGISNTQTLDGLWQLYTTWIKEHILAAVSIVVGFLIGYRIG